jgi:murein L,D-transpeptidase YafK
MESDNWQMPNPMIILAIALLFVGVGVGCELRTEATPPKPDQHSHVSQTPAIPALELPLKNPQIVVSKSKRQLELYSNGIVVRAYRVGLGLNPIPDKQREGDRATPEGDFYIFNKNPRSAYHLSLGLSYPNIEDAGRGLRDGLITRAQHDRIVRAIRTRTAPPQYTALGGLIYIHGNGSSSDWTWGCVALDNADIEELYKAVELGTPVKINP